LRGRLERSAPLSLGFVGQAVLDSGRSAGWSRRSRRSGLIGRKWAEWKGNVADFAECHPILQNLTFEDEDDDDCWVLSILAEDCFERAGGVGGVAFAAEADLVGDAAGFDGAFEGDRHPDGVGGDGDGGVDKYSIGP